MVNFSPRAGKWLLALLIVSVGLNLFLGSMIFGRHFSRPHGHEYAERALPAADRPLRRIAQRMFASLPDDQRPILESALAAQRPKLAAAGAAARESREKVRRAIAAEPFEPVAVERAFVEMRAQSDELQKAMQEAVIAAAGKMSPEGRKSLSEWNPGARRRGPPP